MLEYSQVSILIVHQNKNMMRLIRTMLLGFGVQKIQDAQTLKDAKDDLKYGTIDIIIMDPVMEDEDGLDLVKWVRQSEGGANPYTPFIFTSSSATKKDVMNAINIGVDEFVSVPIAPVNMLRRINKIIFDPRPYLNAPGYFGPCRRRNDDPYFKGQERRLGIAKKVDGNDVLPPVETDEADDASAA